MSDNAVKYDALVAEIINERKIVLNKGARDSISVGDRFVVFRLGGEVHDPKTGESLGILEEIKGKGQVIHVQDQICTIETYEFDIVTVSPPLIFQLYGEKKEKVYRRFVGVQSGDYARKIK